MVLRGGIKVTRPEASHPMYSKGEDLAVGQPRTTWNLMLLVYDWRPKRFDYRITSHPDAVRPGSDVMWWPAPAEKRGLPFTSTKKVALVPGPSRAFPRVANPRRGDGHRVANPAKHQARLAPWRTRGSRLLTTRKT